MSHATSSHATSRRRDAGPAILSNGFRPFFLAGALWAVVAVMVWLPQYFGELTLPNAFTPMDWHAHETLFGYGGAVIAGFLLTAVPNWTGRLPLRGTPLLALFAVWLAGRVAVALSGAIGWALAAAVDSAFLILFCAAMAREVVAGKNWRNMRVLAVVALYALANVAFHIESHVTGDAAYSRRFAVAALIALIMLVGGRIVPSFTHTFLQRRGADRLPKSFGRFDAICMAFSALALVGWVGAPENRTVGVALIFAGLLNFVRLGRWAGDRTTGEALVLVLHLAFAFIPIGFVLSGLAAWLPGLSPSAGLHAWAVGGIGGMTLAVMTRASLGHTGRALHAGPGTKLLYTALALAALARIAAALAPEWSFVLLHVAAFAWLAAFLGFAAIYGPALCSSRIGA
ncbi:NnrS family protein [Rhodoblastus acidophilus]|uniref:NnrS family protein n=1 Tax=Candidatus Rhodoblastus alkanivorans TaxID=2954117 RepID=A0ABS9Z7T7_9HYPH|nr:NnrS family protein [Candidatus Rhodoblastus alkanivorans]MCI4679652.1 NnrS family protein [Candidatus Rhodoblastus alkanivorans]MCI4683688.1 NnrS family protein [Candidatus Rhodoblastus alkanivorans]MDI4641005.1 NnrS family protein [Rhodoblastus acidophilus]